LTIQITDVFGNFRTDYDDEELATLTPQQHSALLLIIKLSRTVETILQDGRDNDVNVQKLAAAATEAEKQFRDSLPKWDNIDELRRISENQRRQALGLGPLPPRKDADGDPKLAAVLRKADAALQAANARTWKIKEELKAAQAKVAEAVRVWQDQHAKTPHDYYREHLARQQQEYYRKIATGEVQTYAEVEHHLSAIDAQAGRRGALNQINTGYGRKFAKRGTRVKLPSQR
jgi:hypothetical protein